MAGVSYPQGDLPVDGEALERGEAQLDRGEATVEDRPDVEKSAERIEQTPSRLKSLLESAKKAGVIGPNDNYEGYSLSSNLQSELPDSVNSISIGSLFGEAEKVQIELGALSSEVSGDDNSKEDELKSKQAKILALLSSTVTTYLANKYRDAMMSGLNEVNQIINSIDHSGDEGLNKAFEKIDSINTFKSDLETFRGFVRALNPDLVKSIGEDSDSFFDNVNRVMITELEWMRDYTNDDPNPELFILYVIDLMNDPSREAILELRNKVKELTDGHATGSEAVTGGVAGVQQETSESLAKMIDTLEGKNDSGDDSSAKIQDNQNVDGDNLGPNDTDVSDE